MEVYKTQPNQYGWYLVIHRNKDGEVKIFKKCIHKDKKENETDIWLSKENTGFLKKVLNKRSKIIK